MNAILIFLTLTIILSASPSLCKEIDLIDVPTPYTQKRGEFSFNFRMYKGGGVFSRFTLGITNSLMLGVNVELEGAIGDDKVEIGPDKFLGGKMRVVGGEGILPAIAFGYDPRDYKVDGGGKGGRRGVYVVVGDEGSIFGMEVNWCIGGNKNKEECIFLGGSIRCSEEILLLVEAEATRGEEILFNTGVRWSVSPEFVLECDLKNLTEKVNRLIRIGYTSSFF
jgi:hypothetical protein